MQLRDLSVTTSTKVLLNIRLSDFNLVMNSVIIHSSTLLVARTRTAQVPSD